MSEHGYWKSSRAGKRWAYTRTFNSFGEILGVEDIYLRWDSKQWILSMVMGDSWIVRPIEFTDKENPPTDYALALHTLTGK
jgi:hypothetical protein